MKDSKSKTGAFVAIARTFHDFPLLQDATNALEPATPLDMVGPLEWAEPLQGLRVVILSPAGPGKTA